MKNHVELRRMAAELKVKELAAERIASVIICTITPTDAVPKRNVPQVFTQAGLDGHGREKDEYVAGGGEATKFPKPIPAVDFSSWSYKARCPKCGAGRVVVEVPPSADMIYETPGAWKAHCPIPGCGWNGENDDVVRRCLTCGEMRTYVEDGSCDVCRSNEGDEVFEIVRVLKRRGWTNHKINRYQYVYSLTGEDDKTRQQFTVDRKVDIAVLAALSMIEDVENALEVDEGEVEAEVVKKTDELSAAAAEEKAK